MKLYTFIVSDRRGKGKQQGGNKWLNIIFQTEKMGEKYTEKVQRGGLLLEWNEGKPKLTLTPPPKWLVKTDSKGNLISWEA